MKAPRAKPGTEPPEPSKEAPIATVSPESTFGDRNSGRDPKDTTALEGEAESLSESPNGDATLRWPQWDEIEPTMQRQQIPACLQIPASIAF